MPQAVKDENTQTVQMPALQMRAGVTPNTLNEEKRTVEMDFTAGGLVKRYDWQSGTVFWEKLSTDPKHIRLERLNSGAPLLNSHRGYDLEDVIGVVVPGTVRFKGEKASLEVRFADAEDEAAEKVYRKVKTGIIRNVSVGYVVYRYEDIGTHEDGKLIRLATDWEPYEVSAVAMGADSGAGFRSAHQENGEPQLHTVEIVTRSKQPKGDFMEPKLDANGNPVLDANGNPVMVARAAAPAVTPPAAPAAPAVNEQALRAAAVAEERERVAGIRQAVRAGKLDEAFEQQLINDGVSLVEARAKVLEKLGATTEQNPVRHQQPAQVRNDGAHDERRLRLEGIENAIEHRANAKVTLTENGRQYRGDTLMDMGRAVLAMHNIDVRGMSKSEIAGAALGLTVRGGYHTTSDFANTLANVAYKSLRSAYDLREQTYKVWGRQENLPDYKQITINQFGEAPQLLRVTEGAEYTRGTIGEAKETASLLKYGRIVAVTREALINDDLGAFTRLPAAFGASAADLEGDIAYAQLLGNPTMGDGTALFASGRNNDFTGTGSALGQAGMAQARAAMRKQKALDGKKTLNLAAKYLLVPAALETTADVLMGSDYVDANLQKNVFKNKYQLIVESRLDDNTAYAPNTAWFLIADPARIDTMIYGYLQGEEGPQMEQRVGFDVDGLELKCRHNFYTKIIEPKAFQRNKGVA